MYVCMFVCITHILYMYVCYWHYVRCGDLLSDKRNNTFLWLLYAGTVSFLFLSTVQSEVFFFKITKNFFSQHSEILFNYTCFLFFCFFFLEIGTILTLTLMWSKSMKHLPAFIFFFLATNYILIKHFRNYELLDVCMCVTRVCVLFIYFFLFYQSCADYSNL